MFYQDTSVFKAVLVGYILEVKIILIVVSYSIMLGKIHEEIFITSKSQHVVV
jgi:hypothetical protein